MGKNRVTNIGGENELQEKEKRDVKREAKKLAKTSVKETENSKKEQTTETPAKEEVKKTKVKKGKKKIRSTHYKAAVSKIDRNKIYTLSEALDLLLSFEKTKFDQTVEIHFNLTEKGVSANITLPHGIGKETKVAIIAPSKDLKSANEKIAEIEKGKIDFDILVATPDAMPLLAKVAKILGPRGLMPNPKNGTISNNPEETAKKFSNGQVNFKSESKQAVMHTMLGKVSFGKDKLNENIQTLLKALDRSKLKTAYLKSTMSPSIKIKL